MKKQGGFTLIELLVVIAIIGILASVILASLDSARNKAKDAAISGDLATIQTQMEMYFNDNGGFGGYDNSCTGAPYDGPAGSVNVFTVSSDGPAAAIAAAQAIAAPTTYYAGGFACWTGPSNGYYQNGIPQATTWAVAVPAWSGGFLCIDNTGGFQKIPNGQQLPQLVNGKCQ
jgi:prepilin-type N-terminal cleavage/methylation domain-containing protein